jgi:hypothetical protein
LFILIFTRREVTIDGVDSGTDFILLGEIVLGGDSILTEIALLSVSSTAV